MGKSRESFPLSAVKTREILCNEAANKCLTHHLEALLSDRIPSANSAMVPKAPLGAIKRKYFTLVPHFAKWNQQTINN
jgi:hypothetical protein